MKKRKENNNNKKKADPELNFLKWVFLGSILFRLVIYREMEKRIEGWKRGEYKRAPRGV